MPSISHLFPGAVDFFIPASNIYFYFNCLAINALQPAPSIIKNIHQIKWENQSWHLSYSWLSPRLLRPPTGGHAEETRFTATTKDAALIGLLVCQSVQLSLSLHNPQSTHKSHRFYRPHKCQSLHRFQSFSQSFNSLLLQ